MYVKESLIRKFSIQEISMMCIGVQKNKQMYKFYHDVFFFFFSEQIMWLIISKQIVCKTKKKHCIKKVKLGLEGKAKLK